jgi:hypothetical protein
VGRVGYDSNSTDLTVEGGAAAVGQVLKGERILLLLSFLGLLGAQNGPANLLCSTKEDYPKECQATTMLRFVKRISRSR